jgi:hypothetical protein
MVAPKINKPDPAPAADPVIEQPVAEAPVVEQPVVEQPVAEAPVVEQPVVETLQIDPPRTPTGLFSAREKIPSDWEIYQEGGDGQIYARNGVTARVFKGTVEEFNQLLRA